MRVLVDNLKHIKVGGNDVSFPIAGVIGLFTESADDIISFVVGQFDKVPTEVVNKCFEQRNLSVKIFAGLDATGFVIFVDSATF